MRERLLREVSRRRGQEHCLSAGSGSNSESGFCECEEQCGEELVEGRRGEQCGAGSREEEQCGEGRRNGEECRRRKGGERGETSYRTWRQGGATQDWTL